MVWPFDTVAKRGLSMVNMKTMRMSTMAMALGARAARIRAMSKRLLAGCGSLPIDPSGGPGIGSADGRDLCSTLGHDRASSVSRLMTSMPVAKRR